MTKIYLFIYLSRVGSVILRTLEWYAKYFKNSTIKSYYDIYSYIKKKIIKKILVSNRFKS